MEPIASSGAGHFFRPLSNGGGDVAALLRDGRVLSAEVLTHSADGTVLLAIGRSSIPAETDLHLDPGARFLVQVEESTNGVVLRLVDQAQQGESTLLRALRAVVGEDRPIGELLGDLAAGLQAERAKGELPSALQELAQGLDAHVSRPDAGAEALRSLLLGSGLGHEAALAALLGGRSARELLERLHGDLKTLLLRAHLALEAGTSTAEPVRTALTRALARLEAEQLLNLARERASEPLVLSFPFPDSEGWATARLSVPARHPEPEQTAPGDEPAPLRVVLAIELSGLGPLRADFALTPGALSVRLLVTREDVAARIEGALGALRERLGDGRRAVSIHVRLGTHAEAELGLNLDIRYLREHHLMNVAG